MRNINEKDLIKWGQRDITTTNVEFVQVTNTPFALHVYTETKEDKVKEEITIMMGNQCVSNKIFDNKKSAIMHINKKPWDLIMCAVAAFAETMGSIKDE